MLRRRRPLLRAAAIGGGAYAVGRSTGRRREEQANAEADQDQRIADLEQQQFGRDEFTAMVGRITTIEQSLGVYDLNQFTPSVTPYLPSA